MKHADGLRATLCYLSPMTLRTLELQGRTPRARGEQHGETYKADIHALYAVRLRLMLQKTDLSTEAQVLALAHHHLPVLQRFDAALYDELCATARAAGLSPAHLVVLNHYTDLRDLSSADLRRLDDGAGGRSSSDPGGCSAWLIDDGQARLLGQTWDMHASATPFALLLRVHNDDGSESVVFTVTGCLGMTGLTSTGVGLTINNLNSVDATVGVVWPAVVRKALQSTTAAQALQTLTDAPIGSGRHYVVADAGEAFGLETSGTKKKIIFHAHDQSTTYIHTNHCVDEEMKATAKILPGSTTVQRYATLQRRIDVGAVPRDARALFDAFADVGLTEKPDDADSVATCGALVMDLRTKKILACAGIPGPAVTPLEVQL